MVANPFAIRAPLEPGPFWGRQDVEEELVELSRSGACVALFARRGMGKTTLAEKVRTRLALIGDLPLRSDFFGLASVNSMARRLARGLFQAASTGEDLFDKARSTVKTFRPVFQPGRGGEVVVRVERASAGLRGVALLEETLEAMARFVEKCRAPIHLTFDEFQEIATLRRGDEAAASLAAFLRRVRRPCLFLGSRRGEFERLFTDTGSPFRAMAQVRPLPPLDQAAMARHIREDFLEGGKGCSEEAALDIAGRSLGHPYYGRKLCRFIYESCPSEVSRFYLERGWLMLLAAEGPVFEAILQGLSPIQTGLLSALAREPAKALFSVDYMRRHDLGSIGGIQGAVRRLTSLDLVEKDEQERWRLTDPVLAEWISALE